MRLAALAVLLAACDGGDPAPGDTADHDTGDTAGPDTADTSDTSDTSGGDTGEPPELWSWCPAPEDAVGDPAWAGRVEATEHALYCVNPSEHLTLEENLAAKALLRVVPGEYAVPTEAGSYALGLPVCVAFGDGTGVATADGGEASVQAFSYDGTDYVHATWLEPMGDSRSIESSITLATPTGSAFSPMSLDGGPPDPFGGAGYNVTLHASASGGWEADSRGFTSCGAEAWTTGVHVVAFDGGSIELELQIGESAASTEPSAFVRAGGTLDGTAFEVREYWRLAYKPEHHHFTRHFAVIFDAPIGDACALRVEGLDPYGTTGAETVSLADCALAPGAGRAVTSVTYTRE